MEDTICAVSTAPGAGGIAVIRISGPEAIAICNTIFVPRTAGKGLLSQKAYTLRYGSIRRGEELIDEVLIALFRAPHSFTGEDTVEITCHGSVYIQQQIMQLLIEKRLPLRPPRRIYATCFHERQDGPEPSRGGR